eukprot:GHVU01166127.1.p1 GENE.GHVU01166127.1~~GHVU01166127.1.p1  ORF type:complete len:146 (-),score=35.91 GHVU01166127.1:746-1183(-)
MGSTARDPGAAETLKYESFLEDVLRVDLQSIQEEQETQLQRLMELDELIRSVASLLEDRNAREMDALVNLGCEVYAEAHVADMSNIFVEVGMGFFLEMPLDAALAFMHKKRELILSKMKIWDSKAAKIKAHIQMFLDAIHALTVT